MIDGGYDTRDYRKVNPMYGTNADLVALFNEAKRLGLKIILDFVSTKMFLSKIVFIYQTHFLLPQVPNHSSNQHEWFHNSANRVPGYEDYYTWRDCPIENGVRRLPNNWVRISH